MKAYTGLASIYDDLMHEDIDYEQWVDFIEQRLPNRKSKVLELACGTGNITIEMAKRGHQMTGVDISEEMLSIASEKESKYKIKWINQDMKLLQLKDKYDCILCPCDGFNYILDIEELKSIIENIHSYLNDGGLFIFDLSTKHKLENILGNNTFAESHEDMAYIWENFYDELNDICEFEVTTFEKVGENFNRCIEYHRQKAYDKHDIISLLRRIGYNDVNVYEDYDDSKEPSKDSQRLIYTCFK